MLDRYFTKPETLDRINASWLGEPITRYVHWLHEQGYGARTIQRRVPVLMQFAEFTRNRCVITWENLPDYVAPFVDHYIRAHELERTHKEALADRMLFAGTPVRQLLALILPDYPWKRSRKWSPPLAKQAEQFFDYLSQERGLSPLTVKNITHHIRRLEKYLHRIELHELGALSPAVISAFMTDSSRDLGKSALRVLSSHLRVFLDYLYREGVTERNLREAVEAPTHYRLAEVPRAITWDEVRRLLEAVDRRTPTGKRDYAMLLLLVTYGLRAREVAALKLDDIDWERQRFHIPERKAGHSSSYPLSSIVAEGIVEYLQQGRPKTTERSLFFRARVPYRCIDATVVSQMVGRYLRKAGITVPRAGSHTLRHTCVQRLVDARFDLKTIGDYIGHGSPASTEIYAKIDVEVLREVALGVGEDVL
jgi:integrase/recombinase XerD